ncbi:MAG TPA: DUF1501 domain-containing protein [Tepidisphaeraceae bacterium]|jgi:hypothetical protein|nr:DUF1501 domain-containing protein [Tepidisphaeraceae bacterium]
MAISRDFLSGACPGPTRRELLKAGGVGLFGASLGMSSLLQQRELRAADPLISSTGGKAKSCILLCMLGGPPQHETWDPKPNAPLEIRGDLRSIPSSVPGIHVGELMPMTARLMEKICLLRACSTGDNAHSTSGYAMLTGVPHSPLGVEGAKPGPPNDWPCVGAVVKHLRRGNGLPSAITLPEIAANDGGKTWPGQDAGFLGRAADPWVIGGDPSAPHYRVEDLTPPADISPDRMGERLSLLQRVDRGLARVEENGSVDRFDTWRKQAFDLLASKEARRAFDLDQESPATRDRYGRNKFGQGVLLARRLVEAGVCLTQVNWTRIDGAVNSGWDTHSKNAESLKTTLMPRMDQAYSALLEDLTDRGLLDETLVVWMGEFGRTPKINKNAGRDHWGAVFSTALAGGGIKGGQVHGASDRLGAEPIAGRVQPADFTATIFHCLGIDPRTAIRDRAGRPLAISGGNVIRQIL